MEYGDGGGQRTTFLRGCGCRNREILASSDVSHSVLGGEGNNEQRQAISGRLYWQTPNCEHQRSIQSFTARMLW